MAPCSLLVLHDYFDGTEGGGRLSLTLAIGLQADLAYGFKVPGHPYFRRYRTTREIDLAIRPRWPLVRQQRLIGAFSHSEIARGYETAVYSGFYTPLAAVAAGARHNLMYCHTPPRFVYDLHDQTLARYPRWQRGAVATAIDRYRGRYEQAVAAMDGLICNSRTVQRRIREYLGRDARIVSPPCDIDWFRWLGQADYYLSIARLDPLKRVDLIVRAFKRMPEKTLIVTSDGTERRRLQRVADRASNIRFTGAVDEHRLRELMGHAIATLYLPQDEDFGMSPVESMAAGKPVIGVREGGLEETLLDGETGVLLDPPLQVESIVQAVRHLTPERARALRTRCERRAAEFSRERFLSGMRAVLTAAREPEV